MVQQQQMKGYKLIDNPSTSTGAGAVNLMTTGDAPQPNMVYLSGTKYKSYTSAEIAALTTPELGTIVWDNDKKQLMECIDATTGS